MLAWSRQPDESARAFEAFELYRDMGAERSLAKVGRELGKSTALMERWSATHDWVDRVKALEARDAMLMRDAVQRHLAERAEDHARRESKLREKALEVRERAMDRSLTMLKSPFYKQERVVDGPGGEEVTVVMLPANWSLSTAVNLYNLALNNAGLTAEELEAVGDLDFSGLTDEEMLELLELQGKIEVRPLDPDRRR
jgi:hypothetical protein